MMRIRRPLFAALAVADVHAAAGGHLRVKKALFPSAQVDGATPDAQLRLITCSEPFDPAAHSDTDNLVVFATLKT